MATRRAPATRKRAAKTETTPPEDDNTPAPAEKKARAPRADYGFRPGATIHMTEEADGKKYRGKRGEYFTVLKACDGKAVEIFEKKAPEGDPPRGWLRFFVQDGACELEGGEEAED